MFVIGDLFDALADVAERGDRVTEFDLSLLARRRRDDVLQLDDDRLHREIERRRAAGGDRNGLLLLGKANVEDTDLGCSRLGGANGVSPVAICRRRSASSRRGTRARRRAAG